MQLEKVSSTINKSSGHVTFIQRRLNVDATSWRCMDVEATYKRHVPAGKLQLAKIGQDLYSMLM